MRDDEKQILRSAQDDNGAPGDTARRLGAALGDRYTIQREIGLGGMATVYLAHDLKHDRDVAIKVLHPDLGAALGGERFLSEIKTTARLQHPHILPLLDSGEADGLLYYVMPFVTGETLRARLARERQLPIDDALLIAREVADALGTAHALGIIHRDIKPENILLQNGHAVVADFGIALAVQSAGGARMTQTGLSLGTPQYMSPEQAMGERTIDARTDVYALGAVTYEMLAGDPPFTGSSVQAIVAKVLNERPTPLHTLRDTVPEHVEAAVLTALAKLPADRFASTAAFAMALASDATSRRPVASSSVTDAGATARMRTMGIGALALAAVGVAAGWALGHSDGGDTPLAHLGATTQVTWEPGLEVMPAISPDGKSVAYASGNGARFRIYVRSVSGGRSAPLTEDSTAVETHPQWSHDGSRILFLSSGRVFSASGGGGGARQELPARTVPVVAAAWSPDEKRLAFVAGDTIYVREADGRERRLATTFQPSLCHWGPNERLACTSGNVFYTTPGVAYNNHAPSRIIVVDVTNGAMHSVTDSATANLAPRWSADGRWLFFISNRLGPPDLFAQRMSASGDPTDSPRRVTTGLGLNTFSLSADGSRLAYATMTETGNIFSLPFTGGPVPGGERPTQVTIGQQTIENFSVSGDGQWLVYDSDLSGNSDIYRMRLPAGTPERVTGDPADDFAPALSPDGKEVAFHSYRSGSRDIFIQPLDGGALVQVTATPLQEAVPIWSPDGRRLVFFELAYPGAMYIATRGTDGTWTSRQRLVSANWSRWSTDGRQIAYTDNVTGGALWVVGADSGAPRRLFDPALSAPRSAETMVWSVDDRTVWFKTHDASGIASIWGVSATGGTPQKLAMIGDERLRSDRYEFQVARGRLYFTLKDRQANVWVMDANSRENAPLVRSDSGRSR